MLQAEQLAAIRGERLVFAGLNLTVPTGGAMLLTGPNGAGKSTLLRLLAGLARTEAGRILWNGEDASHDRQAHAARVSYLGHLDAIKPGFTTTENLLGWGADAAIPKALESVGLNSLAALPARMLSAGQRRRLAIARLALTARPIWLLDEPTLGLDAASVERLAALMAIHRNAGGIVVAATHLPLPLPNAETFSLI